MVIAIYSKREEMIGKDDVVMMCYLILLLVGCFMLAPISSKQSIAAGGYELLPGNLKAVRLAYRT
jgi:hypothetical protein